MESGHWTSEEECWHGLYHIPSQSFPTALEPDVRCHSACEGTQYRLSRRSTESSITMERADVLLGAYSCPRVACLHLTHDAA